MMIGLLKAPPIRWDHRAINEPEAARMLVRATIRKSARVKRAHPRQYWLGGVDGRAFAQKQIVGTPVQHHAA